ncbi:hypothetical protein CASFOL_030836 [Castilleja foliolosa]|uniref:C2H2-type domain-containing protein n=1 Tax=Castilleja foliolosa TaxID=1961234 RepID=A0ABD3C9G6_9LAMI
MFNINNLFHNFFSLLFLLLHLGCFTPSSSHRRRISATQFKNKYLTHPKTTVLSFLKRLFSPSPSTSSIHTPPPPPPSIPSPSSSTRSLTTPLPPPRGDTDVIHPCSVCGELFQTLTLLHNHQSTKHVVSELADGENIVRIIFKMGWPEKAKSPTIHRILKIHNGPKTTTRFENYREWVKSRAAAAKTADERCVADGNELLRFYCTTFTCELDSGICGQLYCSACGIIRSGFSEKMDGVSTMPTSWGAHRVISEDLEEEFSFMHVKRALLVCRVVAGRVGCESGVVDKEDPGYDSLVGGEEDELVVYNPRAVLPCFVIVYTV